MTQEIKEEIEKGDLHALTVRTTNKLHEIARQFTYVDSEEIERIFANYDNEALYRCFREEACKHKGIDIADPEEQKRYEVVKWVITEVFCCELP